MKYKIIVADDHPITLLGTETFIKSLNHYVIEKYNNGIAALNGIMQHEPDIAVLDVSMPGMSGLEVLSICKFRRLPTKIILLTMHKEISVFYAARDSKFDGYVLKDNAQEELEDCINQVMKDKIFISPILKEILVIDEIPNKNELLEKLTKTELKILELVSKFKSNKEIASFFFISERTVEVHKRNIAEKLQIQKGKNTLLEWASKNYQKND
ncbi:MAG: response regulator transcription factor [Bacteroidia bacterium]|nr:response regulator transcription factor [Bacteroidia bacterium]